MIGVAMVGRDAVDGDVWLPTPAVRDGRGPERVTTEDPPEDWTPPAPAGFTPPARTTDEDRGRASVRSDGEDHTRTEPLLWEGDQS